MIVCLDSWAVLEWLDGKEPVAGRVDAALDSAVMSWINLGEVYYRVHQRSSAVEAEAFCSDLARTIRMDPATPDRTLAAARLKAINPIAFADCFAVATAIAHHAPLMTGDPEILDRPGLGCRTVDLRA